ncbi:GNAT family N-acetyltransferase [Saccharopolyspora sp. SCSIO 74807]|uniref:GNAT family N-acetyltransferase n=1 Tax=Saccharopolyspora sp. SCSIO 74807 TaxID=3118084 RepID=UPI0030D1D032
MAEAWETAQDPAAVHALLCTSDRHQAQRYGSAAPDRRVESTRRKVAAGMVRVLSFDGVPVGMFTLGAEPTFDLAEAELPPARSPLYLSRLAVSPEVLSRGVGMRCVRKAIELARAAGADVLRSEANPELTGTYELLGELGFVQHGPLLRNGSGVPRIHLQRPL